MDEQRRAQGRTHQAELGTVWKERGPERRGAYPRKQAAEQSMTLTSFLSAAPSLLGPPVQHCPLY